MPTILDSPSILPFLARALTRLMYLLVSRTVDESLRLLKNKYGDRWRLTYTYSCSTVSRLLHGGFDAGGEEARPVPLPLIFHHYCSQRRHERVPIHSHFPLQVERLFHIVMATAQVDKGNVASDGHFLLVFLLQLEGPRQVLITQQQDSSGVGKTNGLILREGT